MWFCDYCGPGDGLGNHKNSCRRWVSPLDVAGMESNFFADVSEVFAGLGWLFHPKSEVSNPKQSDYILVPSREADEIAWRAANPWDARLPEVKSWNKAIRG